MSRWIGFVGMLGIVAILFGVIGGFIVGSFTTPIMSGHLLVGLVCCIAWFFLSGLRDMGSVRELVTGRTARFSLGATVNVVIIVAILGVANWAAQKSPTRWDLTEQGVYSLAEQSQRAVSTLQKPISIVGFIGTGSSNVNEVQLKDLLQLYSLSGKSVTTKVIDASAKPHLVDQYAMSPGNVIYLEYGEGEKKGVSRINDATEEAITNAILKLTRGEAKKVYVVEGHGEPELTNTGPEGLKLFSTAMSDEHMTVESILLSKFQAVPDDAAAVILANPTKPLLAAEKEMLISYVEKGGRLLLFVEPRATDDARALAAHFGIVVGNGIVLDQVQRLFAGPALSAQFAAKDFGTHAITKSLSSRHITVFTLATSVKGGSESGNGTSYSDIVLSSPSSWAESDVAQLLDQANPTADKGADDISGPVALGVAYEKNLTPAAKEGAESADPQFEKRSRVVVFGDTDWILNSQIQTYSNRDLVMNTVNWLVGEEGGITIRPKTMRASSLAPISESVFLGILGASFIVPELILILGLFVWWRRRSAALA